MNSLDQYILRQFLGPFLLIITVLTLVIWITQSLHRIDLIIQNGRSIGLFLYLSILIIPSLLVILIPFALFGACLYTLYRMHSDNEIAIIFAAGVSRTRIALPILVVSFFGALAMLYVGLDLSPRTYRILKERVLDVRSDLASTVLLRSGEFNKIIDGYTIYVREVRPGNQFLGLLVSDYRNPGTTRTYMAERGVIRDGQNGPVLILVGGNIQRAHTGEAEIEIVPFDEVSINIAALQTRKEVPLELTERYLSELFNPDLTGDWEQRNQGRMRAEAHHRLSAPFHVFAYVLIALYALIGGAYNRHNYLVRMVLAGGAVVAIRVGSYLVQSFAGTSNMQWLQYGLPITVIFITSALLFDGIGFAKKSRALAPERPSGDLAREGV